MGIFLVVWDFLSKNDQEVILTLTSHTKPQKFPISINFLPHKKNAFLQRWQNGADFIFFNGIEKALAIFYSENFFPLNVSFRNANCWLHLVSWKIFFWFSSSYSTHIVPWCAISFPHVFLIFFWLLNLSWDVDRKREKGWKNWKKNGTSVESVELVHLNKNSIKVFIYARKVRS